MGSGPAGLSFAGDMVKRGYDVTVFEALHELGGVLVYGIPEFRLPKKKVVAKEIDKVKELGVKFETNVVIGKSTTIDQLMEDEGFEAIFIGSGAGLPKFMGIPGENANGVFSANEYLTRSNLMKAFDDAYDTPIVKGKKVAVIGSGMTGLETAELLCSQGNSVTVVEMAETVAPGVWHQHINDVMPRLTQAGTEFKLSRKLLSIEDGAIVTEDVRTKQKENITADAVVLALGVRPENRLYEEIKDRNNVYIIGDANKVGRIAEATKGAFECVKNIK